MPLSRSPIRTRSVRNSAPTEAAEGGPHEEDDRGRAARPDDAVVTKEYLEKALLESQRITAEMQERMLLESQRLAAESQREMMEKMISTFAQMQMQTAAAANSQVFPEDRPLSRSSENSSPTSSSMNPVAKELLKQVPNFNGDMSSPQLLLEFIAKMDDFFEVAYLSPLLETKMAVSKLTSTAHIWWRTQESQGTVPRTWNLLKTALRLRFTPPAFSSMIRDKLDNLSQTASVIAYNNAFNKLVMQIPDMNKGEIEHRYLKGLKRPIYSAIISKDLADIDVMQEAATRQEQLTSERGTRAPKIESRVEAHLTHGGPAARTNQRTWKPHPRKDFNRRSDRRPDSPCHLCEQTGHWMKDCPQMTNARAFLKQQQCAVRSSNMRSAQQGPAAEANLVLATNHRSSHSIALDSCATHHVIKDAILLTDLRPIPAVQISVANGENLTALQAGTLTISNNDTDEAVVCTDVLYVPEASRNLVSTAPLNHDGYEITFSSTGSSIRKEGHVILPLRHNGNLPFIDGYVETTAAAFAIEAKQRTAMSINYGINALGTSDNARFKLRI